MNTVLITLKDDTPRERIKSFLDTVRSLPGVVSAGQIDPDTNSKETERMCYARIDDQVDAQAFSGQMRKFEDVLVAEIARQQRIYF